MKNTFESREWVHGCIAVILSLLLLAAAPQRQIFQWAVDGVGIILSYPEYPAVVLERSIKRLSLWFADRRALHEKLLALESDNVRLKLSSSMNAARSAVEEMEQSMGHARVTLREPLSWWSEIRINKGSDQGLRAGTAVLQGGALVGRVRSLGASFARVELITSPSSMIPVVIEETRDLGVAAGDGEGGVWLLYVPESRGLAEGMTVTTAMVSEALPPGIPIGKLSSDTQTPVGTSPSWRILSEGTLSKLYTLEYLHDGAAPREKER